MLSADMPFRPTLCAFRKKFMDPVIPGYEDRLAKYRGKLSASGDIVRDVDDRVKENTECGYPHDSAKGHN